MSGNAVKMAWSGCALWWQKRRGIPSRWGEDGMPEPQLLAVSGDWGHSYRLMVCGHAARLWVRVAAEISKQTHVWPEQTQGRGKKPSAGNIGTSHTQGFSLEKVKKLLSLHLKAEKFFLLMGLAGLGFYAMPAMAQASGPPENPPQNYILETEQGRVAELLVYGAPDAPCVHFDQLVRALGYAVRLDNSHGWAARGTLATAEHFILLQGEKLHLVQGDMDVAPGDLQQQPQGACVALSAFARWTGLALHLLPEQHILRLEGPQGLALAARLRQARRSLLVLDEEEAAAHIDVPYSWWRAPSLDISGETQLGNGRHPGGIMRYNMAAAGEALHMTMRLRISSNDRATPLNWSWRALRYDPEAQLLGPLAARQIALGDVDARLSRLVNGSGSGRGALISNEDMGALQGFSRTELRGPLAPGWDVELYRNGELLGYASDDGSGYYLFSNVPLSYGSNDFEIIRYGPQGQQQSEKRRLRLGQSSVGKGQWHYWLGALQDETALADLVLPARWRAGRFMWRARGPVRATAIVEHGLSDSLALMVQWHHLPVAGRARDFVEGGLRHIGAGGNLEFNVAQGQGHVWQIGYSGMIGQNAVQLSWLQARGGFQSDQVRENLRERVEASWEKDFYLGPVHMPLTLGGDYSQYLYDARLSLRTQISAMWRSISISQSWSVAASGTGPQQPALNSTRINWRHGNWRLRGEARYHLGGDRRVQGLAAVADWALQPQSTMRFEINQERLATKRTKLRIDYSQRLAQFSMGGYGAADNRGGWQVGLTLSTSFGPSTEGWGAMRSTPQSTQGMARVHICADENANAHCDAQEADVPDIAIASSSGAQALSDAKGLLMLEGLPAWQIQAIHLADSAGLLENQAPVHKDVEFIARPGIATPVSFPVRAVGRMMGQMVGADDRVRIGVGLVLENAAGTIVAQALSDAEGAFDFRALVRGCYLLRLSDHEAARLGVRAPLRENLCITPEQPLLLLGAVHLPRLEMVAPPLIPAH